MFTANNGLSLIVDSERTNARNLTIELLHQDTSIRTFVFPGINAPLAHYAEQVTSSMDSLGADSARLSSERAFAELISLLQTTTAVLKDCATDDRNNTEWDLYMKALPILRGLADLGNHIPEYSRRDQRQEQEARRFPTTQAPLVYLFWYLYRQCFRDRHFADMRFIGYMVDEMPKFGLNHRFDGADVNTAWLRKIQDNTDFCDGNPEFDALYRAMVWRRYVQFATRNSGRLPEGAPKRLSPIATWQLFAASASRECAAHAEKVIMERYQTSATFPCYKKS